MGNGYSSNTNENGQNEVQFSENDVNGLLNIQRKIYEKKYREYKKTVRALRTLAAHSTQPKKTAESVLCVLNAKKVEANGQSASCDYPVPDKSHVLLGSQATRTVQYVQITPASQSDNSTKNLSTALISNINRDTQVQQNVQIELNVVLKLQGVQKPQTPNKNVEITLSKEVPLHKQNIKYAHTDVPKVQATKNLYKNLSKPQILKSDSYQTVQVSHNTNKNRQRFQNPPKERSKVHNAQNALLAPIIKMTNVLQKTQNNLTTQCQNEHKDISKVEEYQNAQTSQNSHEICHNAHRIFAKLQASQRVSKDRSVVQDSINTHDLPKANSIGNQQSADFAQVMKTQNAEDTVGKQVLTKTHAAQNAHATNSSHTTEISQHSENLQSSQTVQDACNEQSFHSKAVNLKHPVRPGIKAMCSKQEHIALIPKPQLSFETNSEYELKDIFSNSHNIDVILVKNFKFFSIVKVSKPERRIYMTVQLVGAEMSASKWSYEVHVYNKNDVWKNFTFSDACTSHTESVADIMNEGRCCVLPLEYASTFEHNGVFTYRVSIKKTVKDGL